MTRFLKLIRHEDGKWKALPNETDDIAQVSLKERTYAPIDPDQLLKALDSLLSAEGGIKSVEDVPRLASLMKKFSKKLVSRCVYCNVLQATEPKILSEYLDKGGWETINVWLEYAKSSTSPSFLVEMLKLCALLPMTLNRLKENHTAKLIKSLTKHENKEVKTLSTELVNKWMSIIKGKKSDVPTGEKKKKEKKHKTDTEKKEKEKEKEKVEEKVHSKAAADSKNPQKLKGTKRSSCEKETKKTECYEDVKIDPEPLLPVSKKLKPDRPKTAKVYQKKFRSTGLEEETPLPKKISKKNTTVDKTAVVAAAKNAFKFNSVLPDRVTEKKLKPETLAAINENSVPNKGLKLIPAKPRPAYVLHESASFMDALISQPAAPVKRKKKVPSSNKPSNSPTSPTVTSPTMAPPKLQFYKDTLEMNEENVKKEESEKENSSDEKRETSPKREDEVSSEPKVEDEEPMEVTAEDGGHTPPNNELNDTSDTTANPEESKELPFDPNHIRSILSHGRRRGKKKSVRWVEEENIKEIFFFEMDENERVNVLKTQNFGDMKSIDLAKEREAIELSKRQMGDKMEEMTRWWITPIVIDLPPPLVELGYQSKEKEIEKIRQQATLQEIYFTREMIPDSPHEPDLEIVPQQEAKIIPLDENNVICPPTNYSSYETPKPAVLPEVLSSLISKSSLPQQIPQQLPNNLHEQIPMETNVINPPLLNMDSMNQHNIPLQMAAPYDPAEPLPGMPPNSLLGPPPNMYSMSSPPMSEPPRNMGPQNEWRTLEMVQDQYFGGYPGPNHNVNHNMMPPEQQAPGVNMRPRMMHETFRPPMHKGPPPRAMGPRGRGIHRVPCRHFIAGGCRFGMKCSFLHPGVNGPPL